MKTPPSKEELDQKFPSLLQMQRSNGIIIASKSEVQLFLSIRNNVVHFDNIMERTGERKTKRYLVALHVGCDI
jgi:hypothetical protein